MILRYPRNPRTKWLLVWLYCTVILSSEIVWPIWDFFRKPDDFDVVVQNLMGKTPVSSEQSTAVSLTCVKFGKLRRALRIGSAFQLHELNGRQVLEKEDYTQATYLGWFGASPFPRMVAITGFLDQKAEFRYDIVVRSVASLVIIDLVLATVFVFAIRKWVPIRVIEV